jgi:hypothetical protein
MKIRKLILVQCFVAMFLLFSLSLKAGDNDKKKADKPSGAVSKQQISKRSGGVVDKDGNPTLRAYDPAIDGSSEKNTNVTVPQKKTVKR